MAVTVQLLRLALCKGPSRVGPPLFCLKMETDAVSETLYFLRNIGRWTKSKDMILSSAIHNCHNPLELIRHVCLSACKNSGTATRIFMKFLKSEFIPVFFKTVHTYGALHEDQNPFLRTKVTEWGIPRLLWLLWLRHCGTVATLLFCSVQIYSFT
jgi:hypothetical protein